MNNHVKYGCFFLALSFMLTVFAVPPTIMKRMSKKASPGAEFILRPAAGKVAVISMQSLLDTEKMKGRSKILEQTLCTVLQIVKDDSPFSLDTVEAVMKRHDANVAFFAINDSKMPMSLTCLEGRWAMLNMAKIAADNPEDAVLTRRFNAELNRLIRSLLGVSENGRRPVNILEAVAPAPRSGKDLDNLKKISIPADEALAIHGNMSAFGVYAERYFPYALACRQGWAPQPTNDVQKAIWDEVHQLPTEPIKIKPEAKKVEK